MPWIIGFGIIMIEFFGSILLLPGLGSRILAGFFIMLAVGITFSSHIQNGFFINWFGNQAGEGFEFFLLLAGLSIALLINGSGKLSVDR